MGWYSEIGNKIPIGNKILIIDYWWLIIDSY